MRDQVIRDIDAVEERAHTEISALAYCARTQRSLTNAHRLQRDAALTRLRGIRAVRAQLESMIAQWDTMIDPNNLPEREDCDWREIVKLGKERLQANVADLNRWLDAPLEEEEKV